MKTTKITMERKQGNDKITLLIIEDNDKKSYWYGGNEYSRNQLMFIYQYSKEIGYKPYKEVY